MPTTTIYFILFYFFSRWDMNCMKQLPKYMQPTYKALLDLFVEIEEEMAKQGRTYRVPYAIEAVQFKQCILFVLRLFSYPTNLSTTKNPIA